MFISQSHVYIHLLYTDMFFFFGLSDSFFGLYLLYSHKFKIIFKK